VAAGIIHQQMNQHDMDLMAQMCAIVLSAANSSFTTICASFISEGNSLGCASSHGFINDEAVRKIRCIRSSPYFALPMSAHRKEPLITHHEPQMILQERHFSIRPISCLVPAMLFTSNSLLYVTTDI
jgi:hypothetical protein